MALAKILAGFDASAAVQLIADKTRSLPVKWFIHNFN